MTIYDYLMLLRVLHIVTNFNFRSSSYSIQGTLGNPYNKAQTHHEIHHSSSQNHLACRLQLAVNYADNTIIPVMVACMQVLSIGVMFNQAYTMTVCKM